MNGKIAAGIGEILWDIFPSGKVLGGAPTNFAFHINSLGISGFPISSVGSDHLGNDIIDSLVKMSLSTEYIQVNSNHVTGVVEVKVDDFGKPNYIIKENVAWDYIENNSSLIAFADKCDAICFGSLAQRNVISSKTIKDFLNSVSEYCIKIFDINLRQNYYSIDIIDESLKLSSVLKLNDEELDIISSMFGYTGSEEALLLNLLSNYKLQLIALTKGDNGSLIIDTNQESYEKPEKIDIIDTVGAGDAFSAGLVFGLLKKYDLQKTHSIANSLASFVCTKAGATPTLSEEVKNKILNC